MGIWTVVVLLLTALVIAGWSCARSYFDRGRRRGLALAAQEMVHGARPHLGSRDVAIPREVAAALARHRRILANPDKACEPGLWDIGHAVGEACWQNGYDEALKLSAVADGKIRLDVSVGELLQMSWLAHLGFQHMMPNYRGIEIHRFNGPEDAQEAARAVALLECALPKSARPFADIRTQLHDRDKLILDWWPEPVPREVA